MLANSEQVLHYLYYRGKKAAQHHNVYDALDALHAATKDSPAELIVEIGTAEGGFTAMLRDHDISAKARMVSFDISSQTQPIDGVELVIGDALWSHAHQIEDLLRQPVRVMLFCDGGSKVNEIHKFASNLKSRDFILCHDYAKDDQTASNGSLWPSFEIRKSQIINVLNRNNFAPFLEDEMQRAVWGCFLHS